MKAILTSIVFGASMAFAGQTHVITVGAGGELAYNPNQLTAAVGDTLLFQFLAGVRFPLTDCQMNAKILESFRCIIRIYFPLCS